MSARHLWFLPVFLLWATVAAAAPMAVPGTHVTLSPPANFAPSSAFAGFQWPAKGASILFNEISAPAHQLATGLTEAGLARHGMTLQTRESVQVDGRKALLLGVAQTVSGTRFGKWVLLLGEGHSSLMAIAAWPEGEAKGLREPLRQALLSLSWQPEQVQDPFAGLGFRLKDLADLHIRQRQSNGLLLTVATNGEQPQPGDPVLIVGRTAEAAGVGELEAFSRRRLQGTAGLTGLTEIKGRSMKLAGLPAYELTATARDDRQNVLLTVWQVVASGKGEYFLLQAFVAPDKAQKWLPRFRRVAAGLERTP